MMGLGFVMVRLELEMFESLMIRLEMLKVEMFESLMIRLEMLKLKCLDW